jgi:hypothetical protein
MSQKTAVKPKADVSAKIVVFGVDDNCKPHAAWYPKVKAEAARTAAKQLRFNVAEVANGVAAEIGSKIPEGRVHAAGPGLIPTISEELYGKLVATINARGEAGQQPGKPILRDLPTNWDGIKPGHMVLARESLVLGWWEAIVVERAGEKVTLRWRDYPALPQFTTPLTAVAVIHPAGG